MKIPSFRIYDPIRDRMISDQDKAVTMMLDCVLTGQEGSVVDYTKFILNTGTGEKDINDQEIFSDDIVTLRYPNPDVKFVGIVKQHNYRWIISSGEDWKKFPYDAYDSKRCSIEILGNIHQQPEVLKFLGKNYEATCRWIREVRLKSVNFPGGGVITAEVTTRALGRVPSYSA